MPWIKYLAAWGGLFLSTLAVPSLQAGSPETPSQKQVFLHRFVDCVNEFYKGAELDKEIVAAFKEFYENKDPGRNVEFQSRIQKLADRQKTVFGGAARPLDGAVDPADPVQQAVSTAAAKAASGLLAKNEMFSDVLQGRKDHTKETYQKAERAGWEQLVLAAWDFPFYGLSKLEKASLVGQLDGYFKTIKADLTARVEESRRRRDKPTSDINHVIVKLYEGLSKSK